MMLSREGICQSVEAKVVDFLQDHVGAENWTLALEVCCFSAYVGLKVA
jgi:hypothetical protein